MFPQASYARVEGAIMDLFFYETHLHTCEASACGKTPGKDYIRAYKEAGYAGFFVTDHFFNGNSGVPRDLPWEERIELYCKGYEHAKEEADKVGGIDVFFGLEVNFKGDEFLIYGPDKEWLKAHPDIMIWSHDELRSELHKIGGLMIQAHPFRDRDYLKAIYVHPYQADGFEGYNAGNRDYSDTYAFEFSTRNKIKMSSGSDIHDVGKITDNIGGICFTSRLTGPKDYAKRFLNATESIPLIKGDEKAYNEGVKKINDKNFGFITYNHRIKPDPDNSPFSREIFVADRNDIDVFYTPYNVLDLKI